MFLRVEFTKLKFILKENIVKRTKQTNSLMPDASSLGLSNTDLASISAYLLNIKPKTFN